MSGLPVFHTLLPRIPSIEETRFRRRQMGHLLREDAIRRQQMVAGHFPMPDMEAQKRARKRQKIRARATKRWRLMRRNRRRRIWMEVVLASNALIMAFFLLRGSLAGWVWAGLCLALVHMIARYDRYMKGCRSVK